MKFFGQPNQHIIDYKQRCKEMFCFDENGEFETEDPKLIEWIKKNKPFIRHEESKNKTEKKEKPGGKTKQPTTKKTAKGDKIKRNKK